MKISIECNCMSGPFIKDLREFIEEKLNGKYVEGALEQCSADLNQTQSVIAKVIETLVEKNVLDANDIKKAFDVTCTHIQISEE